MNICVMGLWHLGGVTAGCLASIGHKVIGVDYDQNVIDSFNNGKATIFEPGLDDLIQTSKDIGNLSFTSDVKEALSESEVLWVTFDTPVNDDDIADVGFVINQIKEAIPFLKPGSIVIISSQMPVGSVSILEEHVAKNFLDSKIDFIYSPENLRLGKAIEVFMNPDRIIVGYRSNLSKEKVEALFLSISDKIEWMSIESAEVTKHAINSFLATSIVFSNEIASVCEVVGADAKEVERGLKSESRIGPKAYLSPGGPFAGGTLARDINYLLGVGNLNNINLDLISSVLASNEKHKSWIQRKIELEFQDLENIHITIWGVAYKSGTDTLRRSQMVDLCDWLVSKKAIVTIYDPHINQFPNRWEDHKNIHIFSEPSKTLNQANALIIGNENQQFVDMAEKFLKDVNKKIVIIDMFGYLRSISISFGLKYFTIGKAFKGSI
tara:strand:- start:1299 stop:2609 length:1311 start_codon:yes stop_codon:yes gene_type:complete